MGFRTLEISHAAEIHIKEGELEVTTGESIALIPLEVFMRIVQNRKASEKHYRRIEECAPKTGVVRRLRLTEKQYNNIYMVSGEPDYQEKVVGINSHIML